MKANDWLLKLGASGEIIMATARSFHRADRAEDFPDRPKPPERIAFRPRPTEWRVVGEGDERKHVEVDVTGEPAYVKALAAFDKDNRRYDREVKRWRVEMARWQKAAAKDHRTRDPLNRKYSTHQTVNGARSLVRKLRRMTPADARALARLDARIVALQTERTALIRDSWARAIVLDADALARLAARPGGVEDYYGQFPGAVRGRFSSIWSDALDHSDTAWPVVEKAEAA